MTEEKGTSIAQIRANRKNAKKSTGPQTMKGKHQASRNSLKHGLLSQAVVIDAGDGTESREEFSALLDQLHDDLHPQGALEGMLVERIAVCYWRSLRAIKAEVGNIRNNTDWAGKDATERNQFLKLLETHPLHAPTIKSLRNAIGHLQRGIEQIEYERVIDEPTQENLRGCVYGEDEDEWKRNYTEMFCQITRANDWKDSRCKYAKEARANVIAEWRYLIGRYETKLAEMEQEAAQRLQFLTERLLSRGALPDENAMDKILRYETTIERQLYKAIHELERLQQRRLGEVLTVFVFQWLQACFCETKPNG
jgi:hypothetical protein